MARSASPSLLRPAGLEGLGIFLGAFALVVLLMGAWSRVMARYVSGQNLHASMARFTRAMYVARLLIPAWYAVGLFTLGWAETVEVLLGRLAKPPLPPPGAQLGKATALHAGIGLWWAEYAADRALGEESMLVHLDLDLPVHRPPGFWTNALTTLRIQVMFPL